MPDKLASARFFFNLVSNNEVIRDESGIDLFVGNDMPLHIARVLEELQQEGLFASAEYSGWQIEVSDCAGRTVLRLQLGASDSEWRPLPLH